MNEPPLEASAEVVMTDSTASIPAPEHSEPEPEPTVTQAPVQAPAPAPAPELSMAPSSSVEPESATMESEPELQLSESEKLQLRVRQNPHDTEAWQRLIAEVEESGILENIRATYDALLKEFPNTPSAQIRYISHFLNNQKTFGEAEDLFKRFLKVTSPSVNMYRYYLTYIRRINTGTDAQSRETIRKSYEFAINSIGSDKDSGDIWSDYIAFLNSGENSTTWEEQQKMDMVRKAYQRAVQTPLDNIEKLWSDYESFEVKLNRITAKKFMSELSPAYMQARSVGRDLTKHVAALYPSEAPLAANSKPELSLPSVPTFTLSERQLVGKWKAYLKWEESNPLMIEEKDKKDLHNRIQLVYRKALVRMRFYPEIWFMAYNWMNSIGKHDEALTLLKTGLEANSSSFLLNFAYAEALEIKKEYAQVHTTYSDFLQAQKDSLEKLQEQLNQDKDKTKGDDIDDEIATDIDGLNSNDSLLSAVNNDLEDRKKEYALTYIMYMRFARRSEGVKASRTLFGKARRDKYASWEVYEAGALMEYHTTQDKEVATRIFEAGMAQHAHEKEFVLRYLTFLISVNDENNARALFERVIPTFTAEESRPIWERWARYEHQYGDLEASQKIDKRMAEMYPNDPPIKRFAQRHIYLGLDAIASRDIGARVRKENSNRGDSLASITSISDRSSSSNSVLKRQPSPEHEKRRGEHGGHKRQRNVSPSRERERDRWDGPSRRRSPMPPAEKERPFRRQEKEREEEKTVVLPQALSWFIGQLPAPSVFDGPVFRTDDLINLFKNAVIPSTARPRSPPAASAPPRTGGRPPPDYSPYQGPNVNPRRRY